MKRDGLGEHRVVVEAEGGEGEGREVVPVNSISTAFTICTQVVAIMPPKIT